MTEIVEDEGRTEDRARVNDVVSWLGRHGVAASGLVPEQADDAATQLEHIAGNVGADVIVAVAYGRSRTNEWIFGGVSRDLLMRSRRCCLLAH